MVDHAHIIPVYGAGDADGILYPAMRYVYGGDLPVKFTNPGLVATVTTAFRSDGSLITVGTNGTAYAWDVTARKERWQRRAGPFSPDGNTMAAENSSGLTHIFREAATPTILPADDLIYPTGTQLAVADKKGDTYVWSLAG